MKILASLLASLALLAPSASRAQATLAGYPNLEIVESVPAETTLDHPGIRNTPEVWLEMIGSARRTLDVGVFYASNREGGPLEEVIRAIEAAADRGVRVRFLAEDSFYKTYPATIDRLGARAGIEVRRMRTRETMGGVHHAKYFIVDGEEIFLGSQNFDWRALEHIQELGVRVRDEGIARGLGAIFEMDFTGRHPGGKEGVAAAAPPPGRSWVEAGDTVGVRLVASPKGYLPPSIEWDLPAIVGLIDGARREVGVQLLTYNPVGRDKEYFETIENALRRAAARGVSVRLLLADWCQRPYIIPYLKSLTLVPGIEVRLVTIPEHSSGFIPFARVIHAKYLVVDGRAAWVGTSNWEKSYFYKSRNVGVIVHSLKIGGILREFLGSGWESAYAHAVRPEVDYEPPRIGR